MKKLSLEFDSHRSFTTPEGAIVGYVIIDAAMATALLEANTRNRTISDRQVAQYSRALENNSWPFTGDAIRLGPAGLVLDGQHRLLAIERTGKPMACLVVSNLEETVRRHIDSGRKRSSADELTMEGVANSTVLTSIARLLLSWTHWRTQKSSITPGNAEVTDYTLTHVGLVTEAAKAATEVRKYIKRVSGSAVGAAYARAVQVTGDPFLVANFFTRLATGEDLQLGNPLFALRNTLIRAENANQLTQLWQVIRAWNAGQAGQALDRVNLPRGGVTVTKFPDMLAPGFDESALTTLDEVTADTLQRLEEQRTTALVC